MTWKGPVGVVSKVGVFVRAKKLAVPLRSGQLTAPRSIISQRTVSQSLKTVRVILNQRILNQFLFHPPTLPSALNPSIHQQPFTFLLPPLHYYLAARGKLSRPVHVIALMNACLISIFFIFSSQIVPSSLVATRDL